GNAFLSQGYDVKVSEVHGMSQRGGSVFTYVKCGDEVFSPVINEGEADLILAFEQLEAARWLPYLKKGGKMIINTQKINPMPVITGAVEYPENIVGKIKDIVLKTGFDADISGIDALQLANKAGGAKAVNTVLIGIAAKNTEFDYNVWEKALEKSIPAKFLDMNKKAFKLGWSSE
ncbi:MAG: indolepyruvate oxidoreductase subunit beta, partial [Oscillospiraceae bacterium]|nr:indolepyruvate oxidoreductase subunit beta [Oscillospiraceae bacterium]